MLETNAQDTSRETKLDLIHQHLQEAVDALVTGDDWKRAIEFQAKFRERSFNNTMLIWFQHMKAFQKGLVESQEPTLVAGFNQWRQLGRSVNRGQHGYMIFAPVTARFAATEPKNDKTWRRLGRGEQPRPGEKLIDKLIASKPAYVFDLSQTSGDPVPLPPSPKLLAGEVPEGLWDGALQRIENEGFTFSFVDNENKIGGANGITDHSNKTVIVRANMPQAAQLKTLIHELGHVLLHGDKTSAAVEHRGIVEVEAESFALMIAAAHGMDTTDYSIPYVSGWAKSVDGKTPAEVVQQTGARVRAAVGTVLAALSTSQFFNKPLQSLLPQKNHAAEYSLEYSHTRNSTVEPLSVSTL